VKKFIGVCKAAFGWVRRLHREAAIDSIRNVLAVVGAATILADFDTMKVWFIVPMLGFLFLVWFLDYERHFRGETIEEASASPYQSRVYPNSNIRKTDIPAASSSNP
jgi:hypothetical protein